MREFPHQCILKINNNMGIPWWSRDYDCSFTAEHLGSIPVGEQRSHQMHNTRRRKKNEVIFKRTFTIAGLTQKSRQKGVR